MTGRPTKTAEPGMPSIFCRIAELAARPHGWDGEGGVAPTPAAILNGVSFLLAMQNAGYIAPDRVCAPGDGELIFEWVGTFGRAEAAFQGDQSISWCLSNASGEKVHGEGKFWRGQPAIPPHLWLRDR